MLASSIAVAATPGAAQGKPLANDGSDAAGPLDILRLSSGQSGPRLRVRLTTQERIPLAKLSRRPRLDEAGTSRYLCMRLGQGRDRLICPGATAAGEPAVYAGRVSDAGAVGSFARVPQLRLRRPSPNVAEIRGSLRRFMLRPGRARLIGVSDWTGDDCEPAPQAVDDDSLLDQLLPRSKAVPRSKAELCRDRAPNRDTAHLKVIRPRVVGCTRNERQIVAHGPRSKRRVALTFDDGPGPYTDGVLRILREHNVRATFFLLGQEVPADPRLARRELRAGHELGNHSMAHHAGPSYADMKAAGARIRRATGFTPCTFRPPYGAMSGSTVSSAWNLGMSSVLWDVDPLDWTTPGSAAVRSRVVGHTRNGSIILMHDAGGPRGQTLTALPGIISQLRDRGFKFVTVSQLLGERLIWRP